MQSMIEFADTFIWVFLILMLAYIPWVCYLDWKYREIPHETWNYLIAAGGTSFVCGFLAGVYEWWMLIPSFVAILVYFILMKMHYIEGADFIFMSLIALFFLYNPVSGNWMPVLSFSIFVLTMVGVCGIYVLMRNWVFGNDELAYDVNRGFPMMFPICAALILTVVLF